MLTDLVGKDAAAATVERLRARRSQRVPNRDHRRAARRRLRERVAAPRLWSARAIEGQSGALHYSSSPPMSRVFAFWRSRAFSCASRSSRTRSTSALSALRPVSMRDDRCLSSSSAPGRRARCPVERLGGVEDSAAAVEGAPGVVKRSSSSVPILPGCALNWPPAYYAAGQGDEAKYHFRLSLGDRD